MEVDLPSLQASKKNQEVLLAEFADWSEKNGFFISLLSESICEDGRFRLELCVDEDKELTLYCPSNYPNSDEHHFFFEANPTSLQIWCNALNEFILDSESELALSVILNKAIALYRTKRSKSPCSSSSESEGNDAEFCDEYMMLSGDEELENNILQLKKRWRVKEAQIRADSKKPKTSDMFDGPSIDHPKQIFSSSAATGILTNDLVAILESKAETGINAEAVDDNIYKWSVFLSNFKNHPDLDKDLQRLQEKFGYDFIELQLDFTMDLYPFYPPIVKVVRPRLLGSMMLRVSSMNMLKLTHWNAARDMKDVLLTIKEDIGKWARLDLNNERNDRHRFQLGAYNFIENHLLCLAWVSEIESRANRKYPNTGLPDVFNQVGDASVTNKTKGATMLKTWVKFPAGTGYSSHFHSGWDINAHLAAQREKDNQIEQVLQKILHELAKFNATYSGSTVYPSAEQSGLSNPTYSSFTRPSCSTSEPPAVQLMETDTVNPIHPTDDLFNIIEGSTLVPFLESKLQVGSFLEMSQHKSVYRCIIEILGQLAAQPKLVPLLATLPDQVQSLYTLISKLDLEASDILVRVGKAAASASNGNVPKVRSGHVNLKPNKLHLKAINQATRKLSYDAHLNCTSSAAPAAPVDDDTLAVDFHHMSQSVMAAVRKLGLTEAAQSVADCEATASLENVPTNGSVQSLDTKYKEALKDLQFLSCDIEVTGASAHAFSDKFNKAFRPTPAQVLRIAQEMAGMSNSLPLDLGSSIFVRTDDAKSTLLRALIIGPEGTPYSNGCFVFDIFFPSTYPQSPPGVLLRTTGGGTVRFNPNLYNSGVVCLSLLGTWKGLQGESWNQTSTLLQVLVSIQSLILVSEPYFNEPGFEVQLGSSKGNFASAAYNIEIVTNIIKYAMVAQLQRPASGFEDVIRTHFAIKKEAILKEIKGFMSSHPDNNALKICYNNLVTQLNKLPSTSGN